MRKKKKKYIFQKKSYKKQCHKNTRAEILSRIFLIMIYCILTYVKIFNQ